MKFLDNRPIIACSSGTSTNTAIALIRLSGFDDLLSLQNFFDFNLAKVKPRYSHLVNLVHHSSVLDNCLMTFYPAGKSFTGENTLELQVHGNKLNVDRIISLFISEANFRHADPGEFSFRAYQNKKLSLSQVEGLDLFLNASSSLMLEQGLDILQGQLHQNYLRLYDLYLKLKSSVELLIDFSEDVGEEYARESYFSLLNDFYSLVDALNSRSKGNLSSLMNPEVVIVGETNAGKSSFFNLLLKNDRSIVSNIKGTTRDYISEIISINGNNFVLVDTAGIRETFDEIEKIGISRSLEKINTAFYKILLINSHNFNAEYLQKLSNISFDLILFSHVDLEGYFDYFSLEKFNFLSFKKYAFCNFKNGSIGPIFDSGSIGPKLKNGPIEPVNNSGPIGPENNKFAPIEPVQFFKFAPIGPKNSDLFGPIGPEVFNLINSEFDHITSSKPILLTRHRQKIIELHNHLSLNRNALYSLDDLAISSSEINALGVVLAELIGQISSEDVLNSVFSNFCIGK